MPNPAILRMKMVEEVLSRAKAAGMPINGEVVTVPDSDEALGYTRVTVDMKMLPGARIDFMFIDPNEFSENPGSPECAVSYYGPTGNFICMEYSANVDAVLINYGRALANYSTDTSNGLKNESI